MSHNIGNYIKEIEYEKVSYIIAIIMGLEEPISHITMTYVMLGNHTVRLSIWICCNRARLGKLNWSYTCL